MTAAEPRPGRPRSERARQAVLHAVDDLLVEVGYSAMTMKGIAERAGVGRQTVYRWWSTKAEILFEASVADAERELAIEPAGDAAADLEAYLSALIAFLTRSDAGAAYRALLAAAQQDATVAGLLARSDLLGDSARRVLLVLDPGAEPDDLVVAALVGPVFFWVTTGHDPATLDPARLASAFLAASTSTRG